MRAGLLAPATAAGLIAALAGCSDKQADGEGEAAATSMPQASTATLATLIAADAQLSASAHLLVRTGLIQVFDGAGSYTMLVPTDGAVAASGEQGGRWQAPERRSAAAAMLREHILPGYITPDDIEAAIARAPDGAVTMRALGSRTIRFRKLRGRLVAIDEAGRIAPIGDEALLGSNGVALPLDRILGDPADTPAQ